jgi:hypothetical protein
MASWCSWLSHVSNTHKVPRSSLGEVIREDTFSFLGLFPPLANTLLPICQLPKIGPLCHNLKSWAMCDFLTLVTVPTLDQYAVGKLH